MNLRTLFVFAVWGVLTPCVSFAEVICTDKAECWPEGSAMHTGLVLAKQQRELEASLRRAHAQLLKIVASPRGDIKVDTRLLGSLKTQQAAWLKYRTEECELLGSLTGAGGSWPSTHATRCEVGHTAQRLKRVRAAMRCIGKLPSEMQAIEQNNCLQQLAPLTNK
jgi:uncharacterized protein YecT (DUF1311 family)